MFRERVLVFLNSGAFYSRKRQRTVSEASVVAFGFGRHGQSQPPEAPWAVETTPSRYRNLQGTLGSLWYLEAPKGVGWFRAFCPHPRPSQLPGLFRGGEGSGSGQKAPNALGLVEFLRLYYVGANNNNCSSINADIRNIGSPEANGFLVEPMK